MAKRVRFFRGLQEYYRTALAKNGNKIDDNFKYIDAIYFCTDTGEIYLDGSLYGADPTKLSSKLTSAEYEKATLGKAGKLIFKDTDGNTTEMFLPSVEGQDAIYLSSLTDDASGAIYKLKLKLKEGIANPLVQDASGLSMDLKMSFSNNQLVITDNAGRQLASTDILIEGKDTTISDMKIVSVSVSSGNVRDSDGNIIDDPLDSGMYLRVTYKTENSAETGGKISSTTTRAYYNVDTLYNVYKQGQGILINENNIISLQLSDDAETKKYLSLTNDGLGINIDYKLFDISTDILDQLSAAEKRILEKYTVNDISLGLNPVITTSDLSIGKDYNPWVYERDLSLGTKIEVGDDFDKVLSKLQNIIHDTQADTQRIIKEYIDTSVRKFDLESSTGDYSMIDFANISHDDPSIEGEVIVGVNQKKVATESIRQKLGTIAIGDVTTGFDDGESGINASTALKDALYNIYDKTKIKWNIVK